MFLEKLRSSRHTLALRLTLWYAAIFAISSAAAFSLVYMLMVGIVQERTDDDLEDDLAEFATFLTVGGLERIKEEIVAETLGEEADSVFLRVWGPDGRLLASSDLSSWPRFRGAGDIVAMLDDTDEPVLGSLELGERDHAVRTIVGAIGSGYVLQIGQSLEEDDEFIAAFAQGFLVTLSGVILLGGPIGWFMARRALRGLEEVTRTADEIAAGALDRRVTVTSRGDELERLAQTFNVMLDRIQALIVGMREMTDNLAHDLRSPLARIRATAEMSVVEGESDTEHKALAARTTEECDRLLEIINATLDIAEAESGAAKLNIAEIDLTDVVSDAAELFQTVAEDRQVKLVTDVPEHCRIRGDLQRLQRVIANLLDNALKYTPAGGQIAIVLHDEGNKVRLSIADTGIGIAADDTVRVFERFFRCDPSRSEHGSGLGLSLALAFTRAHGGDITVQSAPGEGSSFTMELARADHRQYSSSTPKPPTRSIPRPSDPAVT